jgi:signal transduction histidine kinase
MGTQLIRSNYFQLALETYAKAIELSNGIKDSEGVSWAYLNLGDFYKNQGNLFKEKGILSEAKVNFGKSLDFYLKALKIISLLKFPHGIATYNSRVGSAYLKLENPQEAEQYLLAAAKGFKTLGFKEGAKEAYEMLAEANLKKGDYKKTFEFYKNFSTLKDSLFNEEVTKQLAEISFKYETEKKEKENVKLKLDNQAKEADVIKKTNEVRRQRDYKRIFFLAVLALCIIIYLMVRNRRIKIKANKILQRAELLKQQTEIRQNISNDLHDEIGSDLTKITILCTQGQTDLKKQIPISSSLLDEISSKSQELGVNLDDLVWTTDPDNDNFSNLLSRIRTHIHKFLENSTIQSTINLPDNVSSFPISPETNRNIYLILKEGLNNVIKHSQAQNIEIKFLIDDDKTFSLEIRDDGRGFDTDNISIRNGRRIMNKRVSSIKEGDLKLKSEIGIGTTLIISGKLA